MNIEIKEPECDVQKAEYGKIIAKETRGCHTEYIDDTPHHRTYMRFHPSGTYFKIKDLGETITKIVNDKLQIIWGTYKRLIKKNFIELIKGFRKIEIQQNDYLNVWKIRNIRIGKDENKYINNNKSLRIFGFEIHITYKSRATEIFKNESIVIHQNYERKTDKNDTIYVNENQNVGVKLNKIENIKQNYYETVGQFYSINAGNKIALDAPMIYLNCGISQSKPIEIPPPIVRDIKMDVTNPKEPLGPITPNKEYVKDTYDYWE